MLAACSGGGSGGGGSAAADPAAPDPANGSLSGTILISGQVELDGDVNDATAPFASNDTVATAQRISNPVQLAGYANQPGAGSAGRSFVAGDARDVYRTFLAQGDRIDLYIEGDGVADDLDLALLQTDGVAVSAAVEDSAHETLQVAADGEYLIEVTAFSGAANYALNLSSTGQVGVAQAEWIPGELIVQFDLDQTDGPMDEIVSAMGLDWQDGSPENSMLLSCSDPEQRDAAFEAMGMGHLLIDDPDVRRLSAPDQLLRDTPRLAKALRRRGDVIAADPNYIRRAFATPSDEFFGLQWHYAPIRLTEAWDLVAPDTGVVVAVIDSGVADHPELQGQLVTGYDFIQNPTIAADGNGCDPDPFDPGDGLTPGTSSYHGSHVAGTIVSRTSLQPGGDDRGVAGVAWNAKVMPLRVTGLTGAGSDFDLIQALRYAAGLANDCGVLPNARADIVNMSLGGPAFSAALDQTIQQARAQGLILVAAAGNSGTDAPSYPAAMTGVISVSATNIGNTLAGYSNFGTTIDVAAPGGNAAPTDLNGDGFVDGVLSLGVDDVVNPAQYLYAFQVGTSMASPHVAGVIALMKGVHPGLTPQNVDDLLAMGAMTIDLGFPGLYGNGLIDARAAVEAAIAAAGGQVPVVPARLGVDPVALTFAVGVNDLVITTSNVGDPNAPLTILSATATTDDGANWLTVTPQQVDASGVGTYGVNVDRMGLAGPATFTGRVSFDSSQNDLDVMVTLEVPPPPIDANAGPVYVLLLDPDNGAVLRSLRFDAANGSYAYRFDQLTTGAYHVVAGTDRDNDGMLCDAGEACGGFPTAGNLADVSVVLIRNGIDFPMALHFGPMPLAGPVRTRVAP